MNNTAPNKVYHSYWTKVICINSRGCLFIIIIVPVLTGCSLVKFATGEKGVDVSTVQPGITRAEVEAVLGKPVRSWTSPTGVYYCTYVYDSGRPPSPSGAGATLLMDIISLGLWEVLVSLDAPHTSFNDVARTTATVHISYDHQDIILGVFGEFDDLPPDGRSPMPKPIQDIPNSTD